MEWRFDRGDAIRRTHGSRNPDAARSRAERRLRSQPLAAVVPVGFRSAAGLDRHIRIWVLPLLGMAGANSLSDLRPAPGRVPVVCGAQALRKRRWLHCADAILRFARDPPQQHPVRGTARDGRGLGRFRSHLHGHRGRPHFIRSARSCGLELAAHSIARTLTRASHRLSVFTGHPDSHRARVHALSGADEAASGGCDLGGSVRGRVPALVRLLSVSSRRFLAEHSPCPLFRNHMVGVSCARNLHAGSRANRTKWPSALAGDPNRFDCIFRLAAVKIFRQYGASDDCSSCFFCSAWARRTIPASDSSSSPRHSGLCSSRPLLLTCWRPRDAILQRPASGDFCWPTRSGIWPNWRVLESRYSRAPPYLVAPFGS